MKATLLAWISIAFSFLPLTSLAGTRTDEFNTGTVDLNIWTVFAPFSQSQVQAESGRLILVSRGGIATVTDLPNAVEIQGRFKFTGANYQFRIGLRTDLSTFLPEAAPTGVFVGFRQDDLTIGIAESGIRFLDNRIYPVPSNQDIDFRIVDDGVTAAFMRLGRISDIDDELGTAWHCCQNRAFG